MVNRDTGAVRCFVSARRKAEASSIDQQAVPKAPSKTRMFDTVHGSSPLMSVVQSVSHPNPEQQQHVTDGDEPILIEVGRHPLANSSCSRMPLQLLSTPSAVAAP